MSRTPTAMCETAWMLMAGGVLLPLLSATDVDQSVSFGRRITDLAKEHPDAIALVFAPIDGDDVAVTWRELDARSSQVARLLASRGAGLGTMVAVALPNSVDHFLASLGAWKAGAGVIPMRWDVPPWERDRLLETSGAVLVVGDGDAAGGAVQVVTRAELAATADLDASPLP